MKSLETTLTWILVPAFLLFATSSIISTKKDTKETNKQIKDAERFIDIEVNHDGDPTTNTKRILIEATGNDEDSFSYTWAQISGKNVIYEGDSTNSINFDAAPGKYEFTVTVTDAYGATAADTVSIKVTPEPNELPEVSTEVSGWIEEINETDDPASENDDIEE